MGTEFQSELCKRLPFGEAVLRLSQFALSDENLQAIYDSCRGRSYEKLITFPLFVNLIGKALLEISRRMGMAWETDGPTRPYTFER